MPWKERERKKQEIRRDCKGGRNYIKEGEKELERERWKDIDTERVGDRGRKCKGDVKKREKEG
jgi:hypothetical protein